MDSKSTAIQNLGTVWLHVDQIAEVANNLVPCLKPGSPYERRDHVVNFTQLTTVFC